MINNQYKYSEITENIIGCAMKVHQKMRNGYPEKIYNNCLIIEFNKAVIQFKNELELPIYYEMTEVGK